MPKRYGMRPNNRKVIASARISEETYIEVSYLAYSIRESVSFLYRELLQGALKTLELAKDNPQLLVGNPTLTRLHEAPRREKGKHTVDEKLQVHDILARMVELESEVKRLNEEREEDNA